MVLGHEQKGKSNPKLKFGSSPIETVENYCYLGIIINKSGSFQSAIKMLQNKAMRSFFWLKKIYQ